MLRESFTAVSGHLRDGYQKYIASFALGYPGLDDLFRAYGGYAIGDAVMPRPVLSVFGFRAVADRDVAHREVADLTPLSTDEADRLGTAVYLPQILRDFLAIHDDIVDGDLTKFGMPTIPVRFETADVVTAPPSPGLSRGQAKALFFGDLLIGFVCDAVLRSPLTPDRQLTLMRRTADVIGATQLGQLEELALQDVAPWDIDVSRLLDMYARKAADYCYAYPLDVGLIAAGAEPATRAACRPVMLAIGVQSQIVNDLEGLTAASEHTPAELCALRRTLPLILWCCTDAGRSTSEALQPPISESAALAILASMREEGVLEHVAGRVSDACRNLNDLVGRLDIGNSTKAYLHELIAMRLEASLARCLVTG